MSDIDVRGSLEALRPLGRQARATLVLSEKLESLVGLEDHAKELVARVEALKSEVAAAEGKKARAEADAVAVCAEAKAKAEKTLADADAAAEKRVSDAEKEAKALEVALAEVAATLNADNEVLRQTGKTLQGEVDSLAAKRDAIKAEIESFKAAASRVLG